MDLIRYVPDAPHSTWAGDYWLAEVKPRTTLPGLHALELEDCSGWREVLYRAPLDLGGHPLPPKPCQKVRVVVTQAQASHGGWFDRVDALEPAPEASSLRLVPSRCCPEPDALLRLYELLAQEISRPALQLFLHRVFGDEHLTGAFITLPASRDCHHVEAGGLLVHSLDVVEQMALLTTRCEPLVRECLLVVALFHDLGKVACRVLDGTPYWAREHPLMNKMLLEGALAELRWKDTTAWSLIHFGLDVIAGSVDGGRIPEVELLRTLDRVSAATDTRRRAVGLAKGRQRVIALQPANGGPRRVFFQPLASRKPAP